MQRVRLKFKNFSVEAVISDEKSPKTAEAILSILPLKGKANIWGEEIYFSVPVSLPEENSMEVVELGSLGYWPQGNAFCIFFGKTPVSSEKEIRPASPVNVFGKIIGLDENLITKLKSVEYGEDILVEKE